MSDSEAADDLKSKFILQTVPFDARFPNQNQTRNCFQNYTDYFKCIVDKGDEYAPCRQFKRVYNTLCPNEWVSKWDDQRDNSTFPASLEP